MARRVGTTPDVHGQSVAFVLLYVMVPYLTSLFIGSSAAQGFVGSMVGMAVGAATARPASACPVGGGRVRRHGPRHGQRRQLRAGGEAAAALVAAAARPQRWRSAPAASSASSGLPSITMSDALNPSYRQRASGHVDRLTNPSDCLSMKILPVIHCTCFTLVPGHCLPIQTDSQAVLRHAGQRQAAQAPPAAACPVTSSSGLTAPSAVDLEPGVEQLTPPRLPGAGFGQGLKAGAHQLRLPAMWRIGPEPGDGRKSRARLPHSLRGGAAVETHGLRPGKRYRPTLPLYSPNGR